MPHEEAVRLTDGALLGRCAAGERGACSAFVDRHRDAVWRYSRLLTADPVAAEDVLQDTFLAALRGAGTFSGGDSARGWLLSITRHAAARRHRRRAGQPARFEPLDELGEAAGFGDPCPGPEATLVEAERRAAFARALDALHPDDQEVLVLRDLEGLDGEATATLLGLPLPTMKTRLHRARLRLAAALRQGGPDVLGA